MAFAIKHYKLPTGPGCYLMRDRRGEIVYIGKAKNLRRRVTSYFQKAHADWKTNELVARVADLEWIVTNNEVEALILEARLIKQHQPKYNIDLKENQPYAYIKITDEEYPQLVLTRQLTRDGKYFGPFVSGAGRRALLLTTARLFGLRVGKMTSPSSKELYRLLAATREQKWQELSPDAYAENVRLAELFLRGKKDDLLQMFAARMKRAARDQQYELAKLYRDQLRAIERIKDQQIIDLPKHYDQDVINFAPVGEEYVWQIFHVQRGVISGRQSYRIARLDSAATALAAVITQYYLTRPAPREIILPIPPADAATLAASLAELKGRPVIFTVPKRGEKQKLLDLVAQNIYANLQHDAGLELQARLGLPQAPQTIDGFDISNISGDAAVGSCVRFNHGQPDKSFYRKFQIKTVRGINDFAMMAEVLTRRYQPAKTADEKKWGLPDLILIDGGKGQLSAAVKVLTKLKINRPVIGLAKREEEIFLPGQSRPVILAKSSPALQLLQRVRNEAHRFAVRYHATLRQRARRPRT